MKSRSTLLLQRALYLLERDPVWGVEIDLIDRNVHAWRVTLSGLEDSEWAGAQLIVDLQFPDSFDLDPPVVKFLTVPYHPNVRPNDGVLVCALLQYWASGTDISMLLIAIQHLLSEPIVNDPCPANYAAANLYIKDRAAYFNRVREMAYAAPIALQQLRLEAQFAHATQVILHTFSEESQSVSPTRPSSVPSKATSASATLTQPKGPTSQDIHTAPKRHHPPRPRVRKLLFESYYSDWQSLATTVPGNNCRVEFSSTSTPTDLNPSSQKATTSTASPSPDVHMSRIPTGTQVASIVGARNKNQVLVNLKSGMAPHALAMHVAREDAVRASQQEHLLRYGSLATTIPPPVPDGDTSTGKVWLVPTDPSSLKTRSSATSPFLTVAASPHGVPPMTFMVLGGPPVATANAVSLGLPSSGGGQGNSLLSQHFLHADHHSKDPSFRVRERITGRSKRQAQLPASTIVREKDSLSQCNSSSRPSSGGSDSTRTYTRGSSALDRWTPSPVEAKARVSVKVVNGMVLLDDRGQLVSEDKVAKRALPTLPVLVTPGDGGEDGLGIIINQKRAPDVGESDDELEVLAWAKDLALDVM